MGAGSRWFESSRPDQIPDLCWDNSFKNVGNMRARIYQPAKTAMQSGRAKTIEWVLEYEPTRRQQLDPLTGWAGSGDTMSQLRLTFDNINDAIAYATKHGIDYSIQKSKDRVIRPKAYADNFAVSRKIPWSH